MSREFKRPVQATTLTPEQRRVDMKLQLLEGDYFDDPLPVDLEGRPITPIIMRMVGMGRREPTAAKRFRSFRAKPGDLTGWDRREDLVASDASTRELALSAVKQLVGRKRGAIRTVAKTAADRAARETSLKLTIGRLATDEAGNRRSTREIQQQLRDLGKVASRKMIARLRRP